MIELNRRENLILRVYRIIGDATPLPADCGALCGRACCQGDEENGMLLFPGEEKLLSGVQGFSVSRIPYMDGEAWFLSCESGCDRSVRPLSCRIFPLVPVVLPDGGVEIVPDPRAVRMCPLADGKCLDRRFVRRVARAMRLLSHDAQALAFMRLLTAELTELLKFYLP